MSGKQDGTQKTNDMKFGLIAFCFLLLLNLVAMHCIF